ncbi:MAG: aminodeoxychorismate/anthranilate synthase component II [Phycisphaerales bacterium]
MILLIDNYDSFTWNLVQRLGELDPTLDLRVIRNDKITPDEAAGMSPSHVIISPGPCTPREAGVSNDLIRTFRGRIPLFGVCLGHQCIGFNHGMDVVRHGRIMHGKTSLIHHDGQGVFRDMPQPFTATRYHSLVVRTEGAVPDGWEVSAWTEDEIDGRVERVIMGLRSTDSAAAPVEGVQFHPESFLTEQGARLLANFVGVPYRPSVDDDGPRLAG